MITFKHKGNFEKTTKMFNEVSKMDISSIFKKYGEKGVSALSSTTPVESGLTASSWTYKIEGGKNKVSICFYNTHINKGVPIAIILQYGHGTGTGGWVQGRDYINPAIQPIFDEIVNEAWKEVVKS